MRIVPLTAETTAVWNAIAASSAESWFWHTPAWLAFVKAIGASSFVDDLSSLIYVDREPVAICPVILEERGGYRRFSYLGEFLPCPAFVPGAGDATRAKAIERYAAWLEETAAERSVAYARVFAPILADAPAMPWNPLLRHGYMEISTATQIVPLDATIDALWHGLRKGHRSDVKRAAARCRCTAWDAETITDAKFDEYRELHAVDAGRVTRTRDTFDMMLGWIRGGNGVLVEAALDGRAAAFVVIILFRSGAYYASSCKDPDVDLPVVHLIQWETIQWLKARGYRRYDLGRQYFGPGWDYVPSPKDISIAAFKRGFGGVTRRVDVAERFYSPSVLAQVGTQRLQALIAAREQPTA